jgi:hypothetical protein
MKTFGIDSEQVFVQWLEEEHAYLQKAAKPLDYEIFEVAYVQVLRKLKESQ